MKTCPACRKRIDVAASKCHYCHTVFTDDQMQAGSRDHSRELRNTMLGVIAVIAAVLWWMTRPETIERMAEESVRRELEAEAQNAGS